MLFIFLLRLVRCHTCTRHHYRPILCAAAKPLAGAEVWQSESPTIAPERKKQRLA
jgi:hypothetical protein